MYFVTQNSPCINSSVKPLKFATIEVMKGFRLYFICTCLLLFVIPVLATAQLRQQVPNQPYIELSNQFPSPGEQVEASVRNSSAANAVGDITWRINGDTLSEYNNQRTITFTANEIDEPATLSVHKGATQLAEQSMLSAYVDINVDPNTVIPEFYKGRPLPVPGSTMTLTTIHELNTLVSSDRLSYTWRVNNSVVNDGPNLHEDQVTVPVPNRRNAVVSVEIIHPIYGLIAQERVTIPVASPKLLFYTVSSLYGISSHTIEQERSISSRNTTVNARPYYVPTPAFDDRLMVEWRVGSQTMPTNETSIYTQQISQAQHNNERIQATLRHPDTALYSVSGEFLVNFYD